MMNLTRRETLAALAVSATTVGLTVAILQDSWQWSMGFVGTLILLLSGVILRIFGRQDAMRAAALERIEHKVDNLALRVVTESQATHRELGGLIEELGSAMRTSKTPGT
jgi:ABC-type multidrug transport system fused ATPase/permease subunit